MIVVGRLRMLISVAFLVLVAGSKGLKACSVCFGDPDAPMTKAASASILFLAVIIYSVLFSFAGITAFWVVRARRLAGTGSSPPEADEDIRPPNE